MKLPIVFLILFSLSTEAAEKPKAKKQRRETVERWLMKKNLQISDLVDRTAENIDTYLTGEKLVDEKNTSRVTIKGFAGYTEGGQTDTSASFDIALRLPNLEKHWQLKFSSYDEEEERGLQNTQLRRRARERNYGTSLALFKKLGNVATTFQPRLELKDPLEMSYILRFESVFDQTPYWIKPRLELFADPIKGTGQFFSLETSMLLDDTFGINVTHDEEYRDFENYFLTNHGIALTQRITDRSGMVYSIAAGLNNKATYHLDFYSFSVSWGHRLYKNMFHYSVGPYIDFAKARSFKGTTGATLSVEFIF